MDHHSTTPVDARVLEAMLPYFTERFGNAASKNHTFGWEAEAAVDAARSEVAQLIGARSAKEIIFTSGATESNHLAIKGAAEAYRNKGDHIITCVTEHKSVLDSCKSLERSGFKVTYLPVDRNGLLDVDGLAEAISERTVLITVMAANNEIGTVHPVREIGRLARSRGVLFHCDAAQAVGKISLEVDEMGIDLLSISAHKCYGPKGVGALFVRAKNPGVRLTAIMDGGGHEKGMRSGTLNVAGIVGLGAACRIAGQEMAQEAARLSRLRERLQQGIWSRLDQVFLNGHATERLAGNLNVSFAYVEGESLLMGLKDIAVSTGSACTSANLEPSHVLRAIGVPEELIHASIRFGLGRFNTEEEVDYALDRVAQQVARLRELSPHYRAARAGQERNRTELGPQVRFS
jgi:cysteine desulfurase